MLLGATGNVGRHILHLLVESPLCKRVIVVTRRHAELANPKVRQVVVNMDRLAEELAPHARDVDIALAAFGVGKGSAKMADEEVRTMEISVPDGLRGCGQGRWRSRAGDDDGGRRQLAVIDQVPPHHRREGDEVEGARVRVPRPLPPGRDSRQLQHAVCARFGHAAGPLGAAVALPFDSQERPGARHGRDVGAGVPGARAAHRPHVSGGEDSRVQGDGAVLRGGCRARSGPHVASEQ